jgi:glycosyltransferase involved in cell wall biosynthesis
MRLSVFSSWWPSPPDNGAKLRAWHLLEELTRRHEVTLCSFAEENEAGPEALAALKARCADVRVVRGNPHKPARPLSWRGYFGSMPRSYAQTFEPAMAAEVAAAARKADALIAFQIGTALYFDGRSHMPRLFDEAEASVIRDGAGPRADTLGQVRQRAAWHKYASFTRRLVSIASRTTVVSEAERRCLLEAGCDGSRLALLPNGVADACLDVEELSQPGTLIYAGSITYGPNLDAVRYFLGDIFPRVRAARHGVTFTVTGSHDGVAIGRLVQDGVRFAGLVPDIRRAVARSAICVVPLRQGGGTRLKILEAMALGTPIVSTSKGAEGLDVRHDEHLLIADDAATFARYVTELLDDPNRARALAANARRLIAGRYTWSRVGLQLERILDEAIDVARDQARYDDFHQSRRHGS